MAVLVKTCCCGCNLRIGTLLIGIFGLILQAIVISNKSQALMKYNQANIDWDNYEGYLPVDKKHIPAIVILAYVTLAFKVISLLCNVSLLVSTGTKNLYLAVVWLVWSILDFACSVVVTGFLLSIYLVFQYETIVVILWWVLSIYFMIVVHSYIEALREDPSGTSAGFPTAPVYQTQMVGLGYLRPCAPPTKTPVTSYIGVGYPSACAVPDKNTMTPQAGYVYPPPYPVPAKTAVTSYTDVGYPPHHPMSGKIALSSYDDAGYLPSHAAQGRNTMTSQDGAGYTPTYTDPGMTAVTSQDGNSFQETVPAKAIVTYVGSE
ncbi:uncharacterized protein LOC111321206 [Stylophora pistillata]|uniref:uncharacterized protein LOC111321206 n=1 Tax=Stylophora pistillata TaxID=50429 RepID=UPI000C04F03F|nr:uncharacterized protein LOC111321206 [Stylophora pistillata]